MYATIALIVINIIIWIAGLFVNLNSFAYLPAALNERFYTIFTSIFLHSGLEHLLLNMLGLFMFGSILEKEIGWKRFLLIYITGGIAGNIAYHIFGGNPFIYGLGASGAIYAVMGAVSLLRPNLVVWTAIGPVKMFAAAFIWVAIEFFSTFNNDGISHVAHLGGLLIGVIGGISARIRIDVKVVSMLLVLLLFGGIWLSTQVIPMTEIALPPGCTAVSNISHDNFKYLQLSCNNSNISIQNSPYTSRGIPEDLSDPVLSFSYDEYQKFCNNSCNNITTQFDVRNQTFIVLGMMCNNTYLAMGRYCNGYSVIMSEFFTDRPEITALSCGG